MSRIRLAAALLALLPAHANAQSCGTDSLIDDLTAADRAKLDELVAVHPYPEGNLWMAEKSGSTVYVAGTIHIPDPRLAPLVDKIAAHLDEADLLVLEATAEDEAGLQALATRDPGMFFITEGPTLIDLLGPNDWALAKSKLEALGVPGILGAKFKPWYLSITLAIAPCAMSMMQSGELGFDRQIETLAIEKGIPIATLDDPETVIRIFADEPLEDQLDGLRITLKTQEDSARSTATLVEGYFNGKIRESWEFSRIQIENSGIENGVEMFEDVNQSVLINRNIDWEPKIVDLVEGKTAILAVGGAHLSGETGVLRALERAGYTISPL